MQKAPLPKRTLALRQLVPPSSASSHTLQTQVASGDCGTPTPTAAPTETATIVPAVPAGTPTALGTEFMVTVLAIAPAVPPGRANRRFASPGQFERGEHIGEPCKIACAHVYVERTDRNYGPSDSDLNNALVGADLFLAIGAYATEPRTLMFDYPDPAETLFVLANTSDPSFRVSAEIVTRG